MALNALGVVRVLIGDRQKKALREVVDKLDGTRRAYQTDLYPVITGSLIVYNTGVTAATAQYNIDYDVGTFTWTSTLTLTAGETITSDYKYVALNDEEINEIISGVGTGKPYLCASNRLMAIAADYGRLGSYIQGNKEVNKNDISRKLKDLAESYEKKHYTIRDRESFDIDVATFKDDTGTPYYDFDTGTNLEDVE